MDSSQIYLLIAVAVLLIIVILVSFIKKDKKEKRIISLTGLALGFILAGIIFGEDKILGYSLIGIGALIAVIGIFIKPKKR